MALYLISGGAGFIGSHIASALVERGDRVRVLDNLSTGSLANLEPLDVGSLGSGVAVEFQEGSITDLDACHAAAEGVDGIFHEAAQVSVPASVADPMGSYEVNVLGTHNLLEAARAARVERFVFAASSAAYGESKELPKHEGMSPQPCSPYASGKVAAEHLLAVYARCFNLQTVSLRYFNVFGPRQADDSPYTGVIAIFARALLEGRAPTIYGDGEQTRDFTFVDNVVQANLSAMDSPPSEQGAVINVGSGERISLNQLFAAMAEGLSVDLEPVYSETRAGDVRHSLADLTRARELIGYAPTVGWRDGLQRTIEWYRQVFASEVEPGTPG
ncbi:MAG: SDR family oxidoreductase [Planctomycetota bacterium]|nr:SDR family oxidoreductase [Planctomycetota bacterium]